MTDRAEPCGDCMKVRPHKCPRHEKRPMTDRAEPGVTPRFDHDGTWRHHHDADTQEPIWWTNVDQFGGEKREHRHWHRAELGVTPDEWAAHGITAAQDLSDAYHEGRDGPGGLNVSTVRSHIDAIVTAFSELLDAATPRPGLVEALERLAATFVSEATYHGSEVAGRIRALASGTGEPGLDVERLARSLRALEARDELTVADGFLGGRDAGDYVTFATSIAAAYANDKGADPTPEPK
jgi:hypothetical protein